MSNGLLDTLRDHPLVADGAMGTQIYERGVLFTANYEDLNLTRPELIRAIHKDFLAAGAQLIETNTFGANRYRLARFNLEHKLREINEAGVILARESVAASPKTQSAFVVGSIGPTGLNIKGLPEKDLADIRGSFLAQARGLAGADAIALETMRHPEETRLAIEAVKEATGLPLIAMMSFDAFGTMADGTPPEVMADKLAKWGADVIGVNCGDGPAGIYEMVERMRAPGLPLIAMPNAGIPRRVEGRFLYMANPEYFGVYSRRLIRLGVRAVGGCCGTTAEHIKRAAAAARMHAHEGASGASGTLQPEVPSGSVVEISSVQPAAPGVVEATRAEKSRFGALLQKRFVVSVEVNPPATVDPVRAVEAAKMLVRHGVDVINIADGPRASARMGNLAMAVRLLREGVEPLLHVCCRDRNVLGQVGHVLGAHELGIRNLVVITGDPPKMGDYPDCTAVYDLDSIGLLRLVRGLNRGVDPGGKAIGGSTSFVLMTGAEPASMDYPREIARLRRKVEAGAECVMTQPVYDPAVLERFLKDVEPMGIPVLVGILPLASHRNAEFLHNEVPGMRIPEDVRERMRGAGTGPSARKEGVAIAREMLSAVRHRVAGAYVMPPLERWEMALEVIDGMIDPAHSLSAS